MTYTRKQLSDAVAELVAYGMDRQRAVQQARVLLTTGGDVVDLSDPKNAALRQRRAARTTTER